jgi:hypothetical protein
MLTRVQGKGHRLHDRPWIIPAIGCAQSRGTEVAVGTLVEVNLRFAIVAPYKSVFLLAAPRSKDPSTSCPYASVLSYQHRVPPGSEEQPGGHDGEAPLQSSGFQRTRYTIGPGGPVPTDPLCSPRLPEWQGSRCCSRVGRVRSDCAYQCLPLLCGQARKFSVRLTEACPARLTGAIAPRAGLSVPLARRRPDAPVRAPYDHCRQPAARGKEECAVYSREQ